MHELLDHAQNFVVVVYLAIVFAHQLQPLCSAFPEVGSQDCLEHLFQQLVSQPYIVLKQFFVTLGLSLFV